MDLIYSKVLIAGKRLTRIVEDETSFGKAVVSRFVETIQHNVIVGSSKVVVRKTMVKIVDVPLDTILRMEIKNTISL